MRILVIDDYRPHGESLTELLQVRGHQAFYAPSYREAQAVLEWLRFDLAFLDFEMPDLTGVEVAARLMGRFPLLRPVIVSAHVPIGDPCSPFGSLPFLKKPVPAASLYALLDVVEREAKWR